MKHKSLLILPAVSAVGALLSQRIVCAAQWSLTEFPPHAPIITFETPPSIPGVTFYGGVSSGTYNNDAFGQVFYGNLSTFSGYTYLGVTFDHPQNAVGAFIISDDPFEGVTAVTENVYDEGGSLLESATSPPLAYAPVFVGLREANTNIFKVEWQYVGGGFFGVDNVIYAPGPSINLTNVQYSSGQLTLSLQTLPGRTNIVETCPDLAGSSWTTLQTILGDGSKWLITVTATNANASVGFLRVRVQ